jgi:competence ComEA-like helix-hairpin-helix protein
LFDIAQIINSIQVFIAEILRSNICKTITLTKEVSPMFHCKLPYAVLFSLLFAVLICSSPLQAADNGKVNINADPVEVLVELDGIGETLAQRIIAYRDKNPFDSKKEIMEVKGIGQATFEDIKEDITIE